MSSDEMWPESLTAEEREALETLNEVRGRQVKMVISLFGLAKQVGNYIEIKRS